MVLRTVFVAAVVSIVVAAPVGAEGAPTRAPSAVIDDAVRVLEQQEQLLQRADPNQASGPGLEVAREALAASQREGAACSTSSGPWTSQ